MLARIGVTIAVAVLAVGGCASHDVDDQPASSPSGAAASDVRAALSELREAVHRGDIDDILALFAEGYSSREATGKAAVREWWRRVIDTGLAAELPFDLATAELRIAGDIAEIIYYDDHGELACSNVSEPCRTPQPYLDFRLERDDQLGWLITGIPSENRDTKDVRQP